MSLSNEEVVNTVKKLLRGGPLTDIPSGEYYGDNYYQNLDDIGLTNENNSVSTPTRGSVNRYYDEKRNYSLLAPTLDPTNIYNLTKRVRDSIKQNDFSESYFFSSLFDEKEINERFLEKKLIYSKRLEYLRIKDIKERPPFAQLLAFNLLILDKLDNILRYNQKHYILNKLEEQPQGKNFYTKTTFVNGANTTKFDFTDLSNCLNIPDNTNINNFPSTEMFSLIVRCDSGGPIEIAPNEPEGNLNTYIEIKANEEHKIENTRAIVKSLNIRANGSNAVVRLLGLW